MYQAGGYVTEFFSLSQGVPFKRPLTAILFIFLLMTFFTQAHAFKLYFDKSSYNGEVWIQLQDPFVNNDTERFQGTYAGGISFNFMQGSTKVVMSEPVKISDIGSDGITITHARSTVFYVFYDDPAGNIRTSGPSQIASLQRFQPFELTMAGVAGDQGNITAINYFSAPLGIKSYTNDPHLNPSEPIVQQVGFGSHTAAEIGAVFARATNGNEAAVVRNGNKIVRYLGPSNAFTDNPWPSFIPYVRSIAQVDQETHIFCSNGFNFRAPNDTPVYQFGADMKATADDTGVITVTGKLTVSTNTPITPGNPTLPESGYWDDATITFSPSDLNKYNLAIYGQTKTDAVTYSGAGWDNLKTFIEGTRLDPASAHTVPCADPGNKATCPNPSLNDLNAYNTTKDLIIGEITTGLLGGFFNSDYVPSGKSTPIKNMKSNEWWTLNPMVAFRTIQPGHEYYNVYGDVIFNMSDNGVYGVPYSDRFGKGPLVETVSYNGTSVHYWIVSIQAPLSAPTTVLPPLELLLQ